jgi:glyoxylase-like metal-dependent hydrolase (beta-lactamase superfamily II)
MFQEKFQLTVGALSVRAVELGHDKNHYYFVEHKGAKDVLLVDAGYDVAEVVHDYEKSDKRVRWIFLTHGHGDHAGSAASISKERDIFIHESDIDWLTSNEGVTALRGDRGQLRLWKGVESRWFHTPGHTRGGCCLHLGSWLFTGDVLFVDRCGRADLRGGDVHKLFESLHGTIKAFGDSHPRTVILPGHDYGPVPYRSLSEEMKKNPYYLAKDEESFTRLRMQGILVSHP